jgi:adenylylsulfate kinase-like enzyme
MIIWIIGKSGAGKSLLANILKKKLKRKNIKVCWIDGDKFRKKYSKDLGYTIKDRKKNSKRMQLFCKKKEKSYDFVICSILSIFPKHQKENRKIFKKYFQIYIKVKNDVLKKRNNKKIYDKNINVVGKHIKFPNPYKSDAVLINKFDNKFLKKVKKMVNKINEKL